MPQSSYTQREKSVWKEYAPDLSNTFDVYFLQNLSGGSASSVICLRVEVTVFTLEMFACTCAVLLFFFYLKAYTEEEKNAPETTGT